MIQVGELAVELYRNFRIELADADYGGVGARSRREWICFLRNGLEAVETA